MNWLTLYSSYLVTYYAVFTLLRLDLMNGTVTQVPEFACIGEEITVECNLTVPYPNINFSSKNFDVSIGGSSASFTCRDINRNSDSFGNISLTRLNCSMNSSFSNVKNILGSIKLLSYSSSDVGLCLGCIASYVINGNDDDVIETLQLKAAAPPSAPSMLSISSNIDPNTCSATVSLNWIPPSSTDRTVDLYYLSLQNGTALDSIAAPANSYSYNTSLLLDTVYAYSVSASSCAGNSTAATSYLNAIKRFSLQKTYPPSYNNVSNIFTLNWDLTDESNPLTISYDLNYSYIYSMHNDLILHPLKNTNFSYNSAIRNHSITLPMESIDSVTNLSLKITSQCGQPELKETPVTIPDIPIANNSGKMLATIIGTFFSVICVIALFAVTIPIVIGLCFIILKKKLEKKRLRADGSDMKVGYQELEDRYSRVEHVKKDENELTYLEIDHSSGTGKIMKPPAIPSTNYADIADLPQTTQYTSLQD